MQPHCTRRYQCHLRALAASCSELPASGSEEVTAAVAHRSCRCGALPAASANRVMSQEPDTPAGRVLSRHFSRPAEQRGSGPGKGHLRGAGPGNGTPWRRTQGALKMSAGGFFLLNRCDDREHSDPDGTLPRDPDPAGLNARRGERPGRGPLVLAEAAGEGAADRRPGMGARALRVPAGRSRSAISTSRAATTPTTASRSRVPGSTTPGTPAPAARQRPARGCTPMCSSRASTTGAS